MAASIDASEADDLEEGEIPSSEDEDESKDAETTNKLSECSNKGNDIDTAHEEHESRKRQRDSSPASSTVDGCNSTPDRPKKPKLDGSGDTSDLEDGEIFSDDEEAAYYPQLVKSRQEEKVKKASSASPTKLSFSRSRSRSKSRSRSPRQRDDWGSSHYRDRLSDRGGSSSSNSHGDHRRAGSKGRGRSPRQHHRSPHLHNNPRLSRKDRSDSSSGSKGRAGKSRLVGEPIRHDRSGSASGNVSRSKWDELSNQSGRVSKTSSQTLTLATISNRIQKGLAILPTPKGNALFSLDEFNYPAAPNWYQKAVANFKKKHSRWSQPQQLAQQQSQPQPMSNHFPPQQQQQPPLPYLQQQPQPAVIQPQPLVYQQSPPHVVPFMHQPIPQQPSPYAQQQPLHQQQLGLQPMQQQGMAYMGQPQLLGQQLPGQQLLGQPLPGQPLPGQPLSYMQQPAMPYQQQPGVPPYYQSPSASVGAYDAQAFAGRESVGVTPLTRTADPTPLFPTGLNSPTRSPVRPDDDEPGKLILESVSDSDSLDGSHQNDLEIESSLNSQDAESPIHFSKSSGEGHAGHDSLKRGTDDDLAQKESEGVLTELKTQGQGLSVGETEANCCPTQAKEENQIEALVKEGQVARSTKTGSVKSLLVSIPLTLVKLDSSGELEMASDEEEFDYDDYLDQLNDEEEEDVAAPAITTTINEFTRTVNKKVEVGFPSERKSFTAPLGNDASWPATSSPVNLSRDAVDGSNPLDEDFPSVGPAKKEEKKGSKLTREDSGDTTLCSLLSQDSIDDAIAGEEGKEIKTRGGKSARRKQKDKQFWDRKEKLAQQYQQQQQQQQKQQQHVAGPTPLLHSSPAQPKQPCKYYFNGYCLHGDKCQYSHDIPRGKRKEVCKFYLQDACEKGDDCAYHHGDFPCRYFHIKHMCYHGDSCKFSHAPLTPKTREILIASVEPSLHHLIPPVATVPGPVAPPSHMAPPTGSAISPVHQIPPPIGHSPSMGLQQPLHNGGYPGGMTRYPEPGMNPNSGSILTSPPQPPPWQEPGMAPPSSAGYNAPPVQPHIHHHPWSGNNMPHAPPTYPNGTHRGAPPSQNQPGILGPVPWPDLNQSSTSQVSPTAGAPHPPHPGPTPQPTKSKTVSIPPPSHPEVTCNIVLPPSFNVDTLFPDPHPQVLPHNLAIQLRKVLLPTPSSSDKTEEPSYELECWENDGKSQQNQDSQSHNSRQSHSNSRQSGPHQEMASLPPRTLGAPHLTRQKPTYGTPPPRDLQRDSEAYGAKGPQNFSQAQVAPDPRHGSSDPRFLRTKPPTLHGPIQSQQLPAMAAPQSLTRDAAMTQGKSGFQESGNSAQMMAPVWGSASSTTASTQLEGNSSSSRPPGMTEMRRTVDPRQKYSHLKIRSKSQQQGSQSPLPPPAMKKPDDQDPRQKFKLPSLLQNPPPQLDKPMDPKDLFGNAKDIKENVSLFGSLQQQFGTPPPISPLHREKQGFGEIRLNREDLKVPTDDEISTMDPKHGKSASPDTSDAESNSDVKEAAFVPSYLSNMDFGLASDKDSSSNLKIDSAFGSLQGRQRRLSELTSNNHSEDSQESLKDGSSLKIGQLFSFGSSYY